MRGSSSDEVACTRTERVALYLLRALPADELIAMEAHLGSCPDCHREMQALAPVVDSLDAWPTDVLRPRRSVVERLADRIAAETGGIRSQPAPSRQSSSGWEEVAPGISVQILATDSARHRISMLVRLAPGAAYPPHTHAGLEELHLLDGELWIEDRKLSPGDYNRADPGSSDQRVWSETGCTCVLITSTRDILR